MLIIIISFLAITAQSSNRIINCRNSLYGTKFLRARQCTKTNQKQLHVNSWRYLNFGQLILLAYASIPRPLTLLYHPNLMHKCIRYCILVVIIFVFNAIGFALVYVANKRLLFCNLFAHCFLGILEEDESYQHRHSNEPFSQFQHTSLEVIVSLYLSCSLEITINDLKLLQLNSPSAACYLCVYWHVAEFTSGDFLSILFYPVSLSNSNSRNYLNRFDFSISTVSFFIK